MQRNAKGLFRTQTKCSTVLNNNDDGAVSDGDGDGDGHGDGVADPNADDRPFTEIMYQEFLKVMFEHSTK